MTGTINPRIDDKGLSPSCLRTPDPGPYTPVLKIAIDIFDYFIYVVLIFVILYLSVYVVGLFDYIKRLQGFPLNST